ncbi:MAG TPA: VacB/RNase II family 3'-5' exoribonuclease [Kiritimatiellia bacterium]|nr:VacB/RNase II family 3'-5' exoribonuclease [Kiritimatiellia bacterium]
MKRTQSLRDRLLEFIRSPGYRPVKDHQLAEEMGLMSHERSAVRSLLRNLSHEGIIRKIKGNRWSASTASADKSPVSHVGQLFVSPQGHGMVRCTGANGDGIEFFIPPGKTGGALHGDTVEVVEKDARSTRSHTARDKSTPSRIKPEGRIDRIVSRSKTQLVGKLMRSSVYWYVIPDHPRISQNVKISGFAQGVPKKPVIGHKAVVRLEENAWNEMLTGEVIEMLGAPDDPGVDVLSILREHDIATTFSENTEKEVRSHHTSFTETDIKGRLDLRDEMIITIDPADARDHDDAVSLRPRPEGGWILGIHIADVSWFVKPGSAVDRDAFRHGNSVYMVDRFIPMLPPYLTSEVCSLKAGRDRLAYSVFLQYDENAQLLQVEMGASIIHPRILLDYEKVQSLIVHAKADGIPPEYHEVLRNMHHLADRLRRRRMAHGALDLAMPEVYCHLDDSGQPVSITRRSAPEAYHLIEEFMLAANVAVAERLQESRVPAVYRIHDDPSDDQWAQMAIDLGQLGVAESPTDRHDIQRIIRAYADQPLGYPVSIALLRNMKRAIYSAECSPHFGLAFDRYTHFTSPIRRYSDLLVHRTLRNMDQGHGGVYSKRECDEMATHCSRREREASEAEEESLIVKRIQYYQRLLEKGDIGPWAALITGSTTRGLLVEIVDTLQRGFIPTFALPDPSIKLDRTTGYVVGRKGRKFARIGDVVPVELMRVDPARRSVELRWSENQSRKKGLAKTKHKPDKQPRRQRNR